MSEITPAAAPPPRCAPPNADAATWHARLPRRIARYARRADVLAAELGLDRRRMLGWSLAQAVLAAWWCVEDGSPDAERDRFVRCAAAIMGASGDGSCVD